MKTHLKITALIVFLFTLTGCEKLHSTAQVVNLKTTAKNFPDISLQSNWTDQGTN